MVGAVEDDQGRLGQGVGQGLLDLVGHPGLGRVGQAVDGAGLARRHAAERHRSSHDDEEEEEEGDRPAHTGGGGDEASSLAGHSNS